MLRCQFYTLDQSPCPCLIQKHRRQPTTTFLFPQIVVSRDEIEKFRFDVAIGVDRGYPQHRETVDRPIRAATISIARVEVDHHAMTRPCACGERMQD